MVMIIVVMAVIGERGGMLKPVDMFDREFEWLQLARFASDGEGGREAWCDLGTAQAR